MKHITQLLVIKCDMLKALFNLTKPKETWTVCYKVFH